MNELILEDKKYVSSKRAAEITGYAKDYVGQLCREGRVPARLVGRSWYVLESALQDHRFGTEDNENAVPEPVKSVLPPTWEAPRYTNDIAAHLPPINRLVEERVEAETREEALPTPITDMQEAWRSWFAREDKPIETVEEVIPVQEPIEEPAEEESEEVVIPIRSIHHAALEPVLSPTEEIEEKIEYSSPSPRTSRRVGVWIPVLRATTVLVCAVAAALSLVSSGYFDTYLISYQQASAITGLSVYEK